MNTPKAEEVEAVARALAKVDAPGISASTLDLFWTLFKHEATKAIQALDEIRGKKP